ncbi:MAG TPA: alpha/beta hydrolase [Planctomycetota bacterium]|nr:alpha/beta hydrolase [Planctomycetota bacterium]
MIPSLLIFILAAQESAPTSRPAPEKRLEVREVRNLPYYSGPGADPVRNRLDLYLPEGGKKFPFLLFFHGGAWMFGRKEIATHVGRALAARGIGVAAANYRLSPAVKHPEHARDAARAFAWLEAHAREYGGDPARLFAGGHSAGGHLAALLALDGKYLEEVGRSKRDLRGAIAMSGAFELPPRGLNRVFPDDPEKRRDAEPASRVGEDAPAFLVVVAEGDLTDLREQGERMRARLEEKGVPVEFFLAEGKTHVSEFRDVGAPGDGTTEALVRFLLHPPERKRPTAETRPAARF